MPYYIKLLYRYHSIGIHPGDYTTVTDWSLILPGEGVENIWEGGQNSPHSEGRGMKSKENFKRRTTEFLPKSWNGDKNSYINLRGGAKIPSNIR